MRLLFLCNTLYQIIGASAIRNMYPNDEAEIILTDHSTGSIKIYEEIKRTKAIFDNAYYLETKYLYEHDKKLSKYEKYKEIKDIDNYAVLYCFNKKYDMFFCANSESFSYRIVNYLKRKNRHIIINWFEDGLSAYCYDKCYFPSWKARIKCKIKEIFGIFNVTCCVNNFYVFQPDKMEWKPKANIQRIEPLSEELARTLSTVFGFEACKDKYEERYIFFEDGAIDWNKSKDVELVEKIAEVVGKENILIKIHPRNPVNRFKTMGYKTNIDTSVPWEIIAANIDIENKVLITMYSQSVVTPEILLGKNSKVLVLGEVEGYTDTSLTVLYEYIKKNYFLKKADDYLIPSTIEDICKMLTSI